MAVENGPAQRDMTIRLNSASRRIRDRHGAQRADLNLVLQETVGSERKAVGMKTQQRNLISVARPGRRGALLVLGAVMLSAMFGVLAISTDVGFFLYLKRRVQVAADASVMAGVQPLRSGTCGDPSSTGCKDKVQIAAKKGSELNASSMVSTTSRSPSITRRRAALYRQPARDRVHCLSRSSDILHGDHGPGRGHGLCSGFGRLDRGIGRLHLGPEPDRGKVAACPQHRGYARRRLPDRRQFRKQRGPHGR